MWGPSSKGSEAQGSAHGVPLSGPSFPPGPLSPHSLPPSLRPSRPSRSLPQDFSHSGQPYDASPAFQPSTPPFHFWPHQSHPEPILTHPQSHHHPLSSLSVFPSSDTSRSIPSPPHFLSPAPRIPNPIHIRETSPALISDGSPSTSTSGSGSVSASASGSASGSGSGTPSGADSDSSCSDVSEGSGGGIAVLASLSPSSTPSPPTPRSPFGMGISGGFSSASASVSDAMGNGNGNGNSLVNLRYMESRSASSGIRSGVGVGVAVSTTTSSGMMSGMSDPPDSVSVDEEKPSRGNFGLAGGIQTELMMNGGPSVTSSASSDGAGFHRSSSPSSTGSVSSSSSSVHSAPAVSLSGRSQAMGPGPSGTAPIPPEWLRTAALASPFVPMAFVPPPGAGVSATAPVTAPRLLSMSPDQVRCVLLTCNSGVREVAVRPAACKSWSDLEGYFLQTGMLLTEEEIRRQQDGSEVSSALGFVELDDHALVAIYRRGGGWRTQNALLELLLQKSGAFHRAGHVQIMGPVLLVALGNKAALWENRIVAPVLVSFTMSDYMHLREGLVVPEPPSFLYDPQSPSPSAPAPQLRFRKSVWGHGGRSMTSGRSEHSSHSSGGSSHQSASPRRNTDHDFSDLVIPTEEVVRAVTEKNLANLCRKERWDSIFVMKLGVSQEILVEYVRLVLQTSLRLGIFKIEETAPNLCVVNSALQKEDGSLLYLCYNYVDKKIASFSSWTDVEQLWNLSSIPPDFVFDRATMIRPLTLKHKKLSPQLQWENLRLMPLFEKHRDLFPSTFQMLTPSEADGIFLGYQNDLLKKVKNSRTQMAIPVLSKNLEDETAPIHYFLPMAFHDDPDFVNLVVEFVEKGLYFIAVDFVTFDEAYIRSRLIKTNRGWLKNLIVRLFVLHGFVGQREELLQLLRKVMWDNRSPLSLHMDKDAFGLAREPLFDVVYFRRSEEGPFVVLFRKRQKRFSKKECLEYNVPKLKLAQVRDNLRSFCGRGQRCEFETVLQPLCDMDLKNGWERVEISWSRQ